MLGSLGGTAEETRHGFPVPITKVARARVPSLSLGSLADGTLHGGDGTPFGIEKRI